MKKSGKHDYNADDRPVKKTGWFSRFLSVIYTLVVLLFFSMAVFLDVFPAKYLTIGSIAVALISLFIIPVLFSKNGIRSRKIKSGIVAILIIGCMGVGINYMAGTISLLDKISTIAAPKEYFDVIVRKMDEKDSVADLYNAYVGTYMSKSYSYADAKNSLQQEVEVNFEYSETANSAIEQLLDETYDAVLIEKARYAGMVGADSTLAENTRVLYTIEIAVKNVDNTSKVNVTKEPFNVLISGIDASGSIDTVSRSDVNIIATVNPKTKKILLTSIPRDYYVTLYTAKEDDKLTHSGLFGVQETIATVESFMGVNINYYLKVNYTTVKKLVDAIGGIEIDSPYEFTTSGMGQKLNGYHFVEGYNYLDGPMALAYCRERKSFVSGDLQRNENQQIVLKAIVEKVSSSTTIITKYTSILDALKNNLETNMSRKEMSDLVKMQMSKMPKWDIETQAIKGVEGYEMCYSLGLYASVVMRNEADEIKMYDRIVQFMEDGQ